MHSIKPAFTSEMELCCIVYSLIAVRNTAS